ncbi:hypothetical protein GCM10022215_39890 [Nocardioides fonticola]|uniref:SCP2 domain-containing protein n=1 Tax=Nocardioides fonticola TaxID=450363 RepID=A0ABP7XZI4_9ACTN
MTQITLEPLRTADARETRAFLADLPAELLVEAVRATSDADLRAIIDRDEIRGTAVEGVLSRLHEYALLEKLTELVGTVRFDLVSGGRVGERHGLVLDHGALKVLPDLPASEPVDVVLRTTILGFVRLISGEANAGLDYLAGRLEIEGDAMLALALGGIFKVPGTDLVAVDPTALDPVDVATCLKGVPIEHLRGVMAGGFRPVVLDEIFRRLPDFVSYRRASRVDLTIGFRLLGAGSGEIERFVVRVWRGECVVLAGAEAEAVERRDATITCEGYEFLRLATGHLSAITGVLRGQLKVKGDRAKALQFASVLDIPSAR